MRIRLVISIFIMLCMVLSACQATPESEPVVNKGSDWVTSMVEKSADYGMEDLTFSVPFQKLEYYSPEKLDYSLDSENISVKIDAQIVLPKYKMPIVLLEEKNMEYSQITKLNKILGLDVKRLYHFEFAQMASTKKQIEKFIEQQLENIADLNKEGIDTKHAVEHLEQLYRELEDAPENYSEAAKILSLDNDDISKPFVVTENNYSKQDYVLVAEENLYEMVRFNAMPGNGQYYIYLSDGRVGVPSSNSVEYIVKNYFSIDEGKKETKPFLEALASELKLVEIGVMGDVDNNEDPRPHGYVFIYKRMLNGVDSNYAILPSDGWRGAAAAARIDIAFSEEVIYSPPPIDEELIVSVTEEGVYYLSYTSPRQIKQILSCEAALLPFEQIMERFDQYIVMHGFSDEHNVSLEINKAKLGMMDIKVANENNQYLSIPVWDFYGDYKITFIENDEVIETNEPFQVLLTINAIDGSIIDMRRGY